MPRRRPRLSAVQKYAAALSVVALAATGRWFLGPVPVSAAHFWIETGIALALAALLIRLGDRQRVMQARVEAEQGHAAQLHAIVESSDDAIISKDLNRTVLTWNYGAEQIYRYSAAEIVGASMDLLVPPDRRQEETGMVEQIRRGGRVRHFETIRVRKDGAPIHVSMTLSPIQDPRGRIVGVSHISRDITERIRLEEQLRETQKRESLAVLVGGLAHDFNNLLTGIVGNASLAAEELPPTHPAAERLAEVLAAGERAASLIRQMLAYAGKSRLVACRLDLSAQVAEVLGLIRASLPSNVRIDLQLAAALPAVEADAAQLQQVVMNLAVNAAEAIDGGPGVVSISTFARDTESERQVVLQVRDSGRGMDEATRARIFDPFYTTKFTGRGLGLSAVLGIVRGHCGAISVESSPGGGSTFTVALPAAR